MIAVLLLITIAVYAQSAGDADALVRAALRRLDEALRGRAAATAAAANAVQQSPAPAQSTRGGQEPRWVLDHHK